MTILKKQFLLLSIMFFALPTMGNNTQKTGTIISPEAAEFIQDQITGIQSLYRENRLNTFDNGIKMIGSAGMALGTYFLLKRSFVNSAVVMMTSIGTIKKKRAISELVDSTPYNIELFKFIKRSEYKRKTFLQDCQKTIKMILKQNGSEKKA